MHQVNLSESEPETASLNLSVSRYVLICRIPLEEEAEEQPSNLDNQPEASTSGREEHGGVFVVFVDGTVALESFYSNGKLGHCLGQEGGAVEAVSCYQGILAVLVTEAEQKNILKMYSVQVRTSM